MSVLGKARCLEVGREIERKKKEIGTYKDGATDEEGKRERQNSKTESEREKGREI